MAFNPFTSFRKYQKFWMATILLLCMVTFVLCTGVGGDLSERLLRLFAPRGGSVVAKLNGSKVYRHELEDVKTQRNIANEFMKKGVEQALGRIEKFVADNKKNLKEADFHQLDILRGQLGIRKLNARYFDSGVKFEDLIDFLVWRQQADRLGVDLVPESVVEMVRNELFGFQLERFGIPSDTSEIEYEIRRNHPNTNSTVIFNALRDEFRVRIAQFALLSAQPASYQRRQQGLEGIKIGFGTDPVVRAVLSPAQLWDFFRKQRAELDVALVPIKVEDFFDDKNMPKPSQAELEAFFLANKERRYDPTSPEPGFEVPHRIKIGWIIGDSQAPYYQSLAKIARQVEVYPPFAYATWQSPLVTAANLAVREPARKASMAVHYDQRKADRNRGFHYLARSLTEDDYVTHLVEKLESDKPTPAALAALVGAAARPDASIAAPMAFRWSAYVHHKDKLDPVFAAEAKKRAPIYATVVLSALAANPVEPLVYWHGMSLLPQFVPLALVQKEFEDLTINQLAQEWVSSNMVKMRNTLEDKRYAGIGFTFTQAVQNEPYHFQHGGTTQYYDRYTVNHAKELEPLRESFKKYFEQINQFEGRAGTERKLKEDDFAKLFFDSAETFSLAYRAKLFDAQAWPPKITVKDHMALLRDPKAPAQVINLFEYADKPILFWKIDDKPAEFPKDLASIRDRVEQAWKVQKARGDKGKFALGKAREIAENLQKGGADYLRVLTEAKDELKRDPIYLRDVAPLTPRDFEKVRDYEDYPLPKDRFAFARDDMGKQVLSLVDLKKPLETGHSTLDEINKKLFDVNKSLQKENVGKQVQILTNKPQTDFYVAVVVGTPYAKKMEFEFAYRRAVGEPMDTLVTRGQQQLAKEYRQQLMTQLRDELKYEVLSQTDAKSFDTDTP